MYLITKTADIVRIDTKQVHGVKRYYVQHTTHSGNIGTWEVLPGSYVGDQLERDFPIGEDINETVTVKIDHRIRVTKMQTTSKSYINSYTKGA